MEATEERSSTCQCGVGGGGRPHPPPEGGSSGSFPTHSAHLSREGASSIIHRESLSEEQCGSLRAGEVPGGLTGASAQTPLWRQRLEDR